MGHHRTCLFLAMLLAACLERGGKRAEPTASNTAPNEPSKQPGERFEPTGPPDEASHISIRLEAEPGHLNPMVAGDGVALRVALGDIYEGLLCRPRDSAKPTPCLATTVDTNAAGTRWTFAIRAGVEFHDGTTLTALDVARSIEVVARAEVATPLTAELDDVTKVAVASPMVVVVEFSSRRPGRAGTFARLPILPARALANRGELSLLATAPISSVPVGTGPLRFVSWTRGESITLARFERYWGEPAGAAKINYLVVPSRERAYAMARNGKLDVVPQLPVAEALEIAALAANVDAYTYSRPAYLAAVYNTRVAALASASNRRALTQLLDRPAVIDAILAGQATPISGPFLAPEADPTLSPLPFEPAVAKPLLAGVRLRLLYPVESRTMARIADIWSADAREIASLVPTPAPFSAVLARARSGDFDVALLAFTTDRELDLFDRFHSSQIGKENYGAVADTELDELLEAARIADSNLDRLRLTRAVHRRLQELAPYAFIASDVRAGLVATGIGGVAQGDGLAARFLWRQCYQRRGQRRDQRCERR